MRVGQISPLSTWRYFDGYRGIAEFKPKFTLVYVFCLNGNWYETYVLMKTDGANHRRREELTVMRMLVVNGSPLGKKGVTYILQEAFVKGASRAGAEVEEVFLNKKKIRACKGCFSCWIKTPGRCVIRDDQADLLEKCRRAEVFVLATPLYVDGMSGQAKTFLDRMIPLALPEFILVNGHCRHPAAHESFSKFVLISNCGFHELDNFDALVMHCKRICLNSQSQYAGHILRPHGPMLRYPEMLPAQINSVLEAVERAGEEVIAKGGISQPTMDDAAKEILPKEAYVQGANAYWRQEMEKYAKRARS
jgi:multimeric flavodoxin WrbA